MRLMKEATRAAAVGLALTLSLFAPPTRAQTVPVVRVVQAPIGAGFEIAPAVAVTAQPAAYLPAAMLPTPIMPLLAASPAPAPLPAAAAARAPEAAAASQPNSAAGLREAGARISSIETGKDGGSNAARLGTFLSGFWEGASPRPGADAAAVDAPRADAPRTAPLARSSYRGRAAGLISAAALFAPTAALAASSASSAAVNAESAAWAWIAGLVSWVLFDRSLLVSIVIGALVATGWPTLAIIVFLLSNSTTKSKDKK